jgi:hypothetical protein
VAVYASRSAQPAVRPDYGERVGGVFVQRAWGGGVLGEAGDAESHQQGRRGGEEIGKPSSVACEREDEWNSEGRRCGWSDGRDGVRESLERGEDVMA